MKIISFSNQKGGVAKTTSCLNLAAQAALKGKVLLIDCDKQANLTQNLGVNNPETTIKEVFLEEEFSIINVRKDMDLIPSSVDFAGIDLIIQSNYAREYILDKALKKLESKYDYVFIDCPPDLNLVTVNALTTSNFVIVPVQASQFSMNGVSIMIEFITQIKKNLNSSLAILGILITQFDERLIISKTIEKDLLENDWGDALFSTKIRKNTAIKNSQHKNNCQTIFEYDKKSKGAIDYMNLGKEVLKKINMYS